MQQIAPLPFTPLRPIRFERPDPLRSCRPRALALAASPPRSTRRQSSDCDNWHCCTRSTQQMWRQPQWMHRPQRPPMRPQSKVTAVAAALVALQRRARWRDRAWSAAPVDGALVRRDQPSSPRPSPPPFPPLFRPRCPSPPWPEHRLHGALLVLMPLLLQLWALRLQLRALRLQQRPRQRRLQWRRSPATTLRRRLAPALPLGPLLQRRAGSSPAAR